MAIVIGILQALVVLLYPVAVYFGLSHFSARGVGFLILALMAPSLVKLVVRRRKQLMATIGLPIAVAVLMLLAIVSNDARYVLAYPALVNLVLLLQFALTLRRGGASQVERFARLQVDYLSPEEMRYCRTVTAAWCAFFVLNGSACALFAALAPRSWWALYTGLVSYVILGVLFSVEFTLRKYLFRRYGAGPHDRLFAWLWPAAAAPFPSAPLSAGAEWVPPQADGQPP
jgi:uncharacterized membrane protein